MVLEIPDLVPHVGKESVGPKPSEAVVGDENTTKAPLEPKPHIVYKVQYRNVISEQIVYTRESEGQIAIGSQGPDQLPVLELITDVQTNATLQDGQQLKDPPQSVIDVGKPCLKINSPAIINALQKVVEYYPGQNFSGESISVPEPFAILIHHESELASFRETYAPGTIQSQTEYCEREKNTYEHLAVLQNFLKQRVGASIAAERERYKNGFATFDMLWMLLRPGTTVYCQNHYSGDYDAFVIESVASSDARDPTSPLVIEMWLLDFDGDRIGRRSLVTQQKSFNGEKRISGLEVFPCEHWKDKKTETTVKGLRESLEERGKLFFELTSRRCMNFDGLTASWPRKYLKGLVMADSESYYMHVSPKSKPMLGLLSDGVPQAVHQCWCTICLRNKAGVDMRKTSKYSEYDDIIPEKTKELTPHQYLLCSDSVNAFFMKTRTWEVLDVACISAPSFDRDMIDSLVMADERRQMIKALAENYVQKRSGGPAPAYRPWTADFIEGKGEGKIFLLHGKPGVGKTYTAECIAQFTQRPLLSLTISDIGTDPALAEANLSSHFERAKLWDAIILIDEADIYMERRETTDLTRNSLVSSFLRAMENCQSILFLTTNRVGAFDDAFISRIHISLYYPDFSEDDRKKVWRNFFNKLIKDRGDIMRIPIDTRDYTNGAEVRAVRWNGREIRNGKDATSLSTRLKAFQTAVALADYEGTKDEEGKILLKDTHIMQIVRMSKEFKTYLRELHQGDESKRAERQRIRFDTYDARSEDNDKGQRRI
ncbi:MAG: hypothetical protein Q9172_003805 [Xanthocarpia lactea]